MAREATPQDVQVASDRLKGNGAWNGQGLLVFLVSTSRRDPLRAELEPLQALCQRVIDTADDGLPNPLSDEEAATIDGLLAYSTEWQAVIDAALAAEAAAAPVGE